MFGTPANGLYQATVGQFNALRDQINDLHLIVMDEAHKIFHRMPSYQPAFDSMKKFQQIPYKILAMSATLMTDQIQLLKRDFLHSDNCVVITEGVHQKNLVLKLKRYRRQKQFVNDMDAETDAVDGVDDVETDNGDALSTETSSWTRTAQEITDIVDSEVTVVYLDFVRDVEQMTNFLSKNTVNVMKYTGQMALEDRVLAENRLLKGDTSVLVATESFELGVDNPRITQIVRIGCPRNLGVLLQELGRAGRKEGMLANAFLYFNELVDDKRLGLWLKSSLDCATNEEAHESMKSAVIMGYAKAWQFIYTVYHGKCLAWALSHFYGGTDDIDPPTCFISNSPSCMICGVSDLLCEENFDIKNHLTTLLATVQQLQNGGLCGITKTLLVGTLMKTMSEYICKCLESVDDECVPWVELSKITIKFIADMCFHQKGRSSN